MLKCWSTDDRSKCFVFPVQLCVAGVQQIAGSLATGKGKGKGKR